MKKTYQIIVTVLAIFVMVVSGIHINNMNNVFASSVRLSCISEDLVLIDTGSYEVNKGYSRIEKLDYWNSQSLTRFSTSLFRRSQALHRGQERQEMSIVTLDITFKVVFLSIVMILFATGGAGLSMPFRCLLCYIHGLDGKKRIA